MGLFSTRYQEYFSYKNDTDCSFKAACKTFEDINQGINTSDEALQQIKLTFQNMLETSICPIQLQHEARILLAKTLYIEGCKKRKFFKIEEGIQHLDIALANKYISSNMQLEILLTKAVFLKNFSKHRNAFILTYITAYVLGAELEKATIVQEFKSLSHTIEESLHQILAVWIYSLETEDLLLAKILMLSISQESCYYLPHIEEIKDPFISVDRFKAIFNRLLIDILGSG